MVVKNVVSTHNFIAYLDITDNNIDERVVFDENIDEDCWNRFNLSDFLHDFFRTRGPVYPLREFPFLPPFSFLSLPSFSTSCAALK